MSESVCNQLLYLTPMLTANQVVNELVREDIHLQSHHSS